MKRKLLVILTIISLLICAISPGIYADKNGDDDNIGQATYGDIESEDDELEQDDEEEKLEDEEGLGKGKENKEKNKEKNVEKNIEKNLIKEEAMEKKAALEKEKDELETTKDELEAAKEALEEQYEAAVEAGNAELAQQLLASLEEARNEFSEAKALFMQKKDEMKALIKSYYTDEELEVIDELSKKLSEIEDLKVLSVDNIFAKGRVLKFDTPPVIKHNRTLIPVRALTEGFGAEVHWDPETKEVKITSGDKVMVMKLDSRTVLVNDEEIEIDVEPEVISNRTLVPLRFIAETLGLKVEWDQETGVIEIEE